MSVAANMNLPKLIEQFGTDEKCRHYLEDLRWPDGVRCPRCNSDKIARIRTRKQLDCSSCRYRFSVTVGTIFHDSHLPLWKWFAAVYLIIESRKGISANQLKRILGVADKTAWYLTHRIRAAMKAHAPLPHGGVVEIDETYIGGHKKGRQGRRDVSMVFGAIERGGKVRAKIEKRATAENLRRFIRGTVNEDAEAVMTDSWKGYKHVGYGQTRHEAVDQSDEERVRGDVHANTGENVWSLLKRSIVGSYHQLSAKHLDAYLDEFTFRFNGRENPYLFRDTLLGLIGEEPLTYRELVDGHGEASEPGS